MGEIPASEIKPGNVIRHFFESNFGLHKIEGTVTRKEDDVLVGGEPFVRICLDEARCSDISISAPGGGYLYGDGGLVMHNYAFGVMPSKRILLLESGPTVELPNEILHGAVPMKSIWSWSPGDSSRSSLVTVEEYFENSEGEWIRFVDTHGSEWVLEPEAFHGQCNFVQDQGKGDTIPEMMEDVIKGSRWMFDIDPERDPTDLVLVRVASVEWRREEENMVGYVRAHRLGEHKTFEIRLAEFAGRIARP